MKIRYKSGKALQASPICIYYFKQAMFALLQAHTPTNVSWLRWIVLISTSVFSDV
jgi:hypothetical protein